MINKFSKIGYYLYSLISFLLDGVATMAGVPGVIIGSWLCFIKTFSDFQLPLRSILWTCNPCHHDFDDDACLLLCALYLDVFFSNTIQNFLNLPLEVSLKDFFKVFHELWKNGFLLEVLMMLFFLYIMLEYCLHRNLTTHIFKKCHCFHFPAWFLLI